VLVPTASSIIKLFGRLFSLAWNNDKILILVLKDTLWKALQSCTNKSLFQNKKRFLLSLRQWEVTELFHFEYGVNYQNKSIGYNFCTTFHGASQDFTIYVRRALCKIENIAKLLPHPIIINHSVRISLSSNHRKHLIQWLQNSLLYIGERERG
jgi:hypothetical protein